MGEDLVFTNTSETFDDSTVYSWNFGDGNSRNTIHPSYKYNQHGTYQVVLQATTFGMCTNTFFDTVVIHPNPQADFSFDNECQYDTVQFLNSSSIFSGSFNSFWNFGDSITSNESSVNHYYKVPGNYFVTLKVVSDFACSHDTTIMTEVYPIPEANFVVGNVCRDTLTPITNTSTINSGSMTYLWSFGNSDQSTEEHPNYVYPMDETYTINLVTTSNYSCTDTIEHQVTIHPIPKTNFIADPVCFGYPSNFINTTSINKGYINLYLWNYNDQSFSIDAEGTHLYAVDGTYNVSLRAVSDKGCFKDTLIPVIVNPTPVIDFEFENECIYSTVQFLNQSLINTGVQTYSWQFGDDSLSIEESPSHIYESFGLFPVQLTALSDQGCSDSLIQLIEIYSLPLVDAGLDTVVSYGYSTPLMGISPSAVEVSWTPALLVGHNTSLITEARPLVDTVFTLMVTDEYGCINYDDLKIRVDKDYKVLASNIVTPNGDGKNDTWKVFNASSFDDIEIRIYDKWGMEVFTANDYNEEWDGVLSLEKLPEGTYYYTITFSGADKVYKGAVTILR